MVRVARITESDDMRDEGGASVRDGRAFEPAWQPCEPAVAASAWGAHQVHLWWLALDDPPLPSARLVACLDDAEQARAARLRFARDRRHFEHARGLLRHVLAAYVGGVPRELSFRYGAAGKPALAATPGEGPQLEFNLSHSAGHALIGIARSAPLGVDIEAERELLDGEEIVRRNFSAAEAAGWLDLPAERRRAAFFAMWTAKEACTKALGAGLGLPLGHFELMADRLEPVALRAVDGDRQAVAAWSLWGFELAAGLRAAVAAPARDLRLRCHRWGPPDEAGARSVETGAGATPRIVSLRDDPRVP
jgi:4'-phosphopantetheinyl transferase